MGTTYTGHKVHTMQTLIGIIWPTRTRTTIIIPHPALLRAGTAPYNITIRTYLDSIGALRSWNLVKGDDGVTPGYQLGFA